MDPLIRQTSLEVLLAHHRELTPAQLTEALRLGLSDPDLQVNQRAWGFVKGHKRVTEFKAELNGFIDRLKGEGSLLSLQTAAEILRLLKPRAKGSIR